MRTSFVLTALCIFLFVSTLTECNADSLVFSDSTFGLGDYTQFSYQSQPSISITALQNAMDGNPSPSLGIAISTPVTGTVRHGFIANGFSFDPSISGRIISIDFSIDKLFTDNTSVSSNSVRAFIQQGNKFYSQSIAIPNIQGVWLTGSQQGIQQNDFSLIDFSTGEANGAQHPDFSGGLMRFGFNQLRTAIGGDFADHLYDNLVVRVNYSSLTPHGPVIWPTAAGGNGHAYEFIRADGIDWPAARDAAAAHHFQGVAGYLATATSAGENQFLNSLISDAISQQGVSPFREAWLGAYQLNPASPADQSWAWITDEPWSDLNWDSDEPNDGSGDERYLGIWGPDGSGPSGTWNDQGGPNDPFVAQNIQGYLVEYPVPEPAGLLLALSLAALAPLRRWVCACTLLRAR